MNAELIDISEYEYSGEGANGASYNHRGDAHIMLKLYNENYPQKLIEIELEKAKNVYNLGIPTPKPGTLVTDGKRYGIRFERILGKKSFSRIIGDTPELTEQYAREFARMCKKLHSTECPTDKFTNAKDQYKRDLSESPFFSETEKAKIAAFIDSVPDTPTAVHGDMQFSNAITDGKNNYFIDLGDFGYGNPLFDLGMVLLCCYYDSDEFVEDVFHMTQDTAHKFWEYFAREYFGENVDLKEIDAKLRPYAGLKTIIIERNCNCVMPEFRALLGEILK